MNNAKPHGLFYARLKSNERFIMHMSGELEP